MNYEYEYGLDTLTCMQKLSFYFIDLTLLPNKQIHKKKKDFPSQAFNLLQRQPLSLTSSCGVDFFDDVDFGVLTLPFEPFENLEELSTDEADVITFLQLLLFEDFPFAVNFISLKLPLRLISSRHWDVNRLDGVDRKDGTATLTVVLFCLMLTAPTPFFTRLHFFTFFVLVELGMFLFFLLR
jgi:hypothetical protein